MTSAQRGLERMKPGAAMASVDPRGDTDAGEQRLVRIDLIKLEAHRQTLDNLDPIAGRILGRQDREIRSGARTHADDVRLELAIRISVDVDRCLLTRTHVSEAGFAEIRLDPDAPARHQREHGRTGIDEAADLEVVDLRHDAVVGRRHRRIGEIEPSTVELRLGRADRRMAVVLDVRIAVQRNYGVGDLLFDRCDVLTSDLEIRLGALEDRARGKIGGHQRFLAVILALVKGSRILGRLQFGLLLAVGRLERIDLEARAAKPRLGLIDRNLVGLRIDSEQHLALPDALVVPDGDFDRLAGNPGVDGDLRRANERVVGRDVRLLGEVHGGAEYGHHDRQCEHQGPAQPLPERPSGNRGHTHRCGAIDNPIELRLHRSVRSCRRGYTNIRNLAELLAVAYPAGDWRNI